MHLCHLFSQRRHEVTQGNEDKTHHQRKIGTPGRDAFAQEPHDHHRKDGDEIETVHFLEIAKNAVLPQQHRSHHHGDDRDDDPKALANLNHLRVVSFPTSNHSLVDAQAEQRGGTVQRGIEGTQDGSHHDRCKEASQ